MNRFNINSRALATGAAVALFALLLIILLAVVGCTRTAPERWCEIDRGDILVPNSQCEAKVPGTEWEPAADDPKYKRKPVKITAPARTSPPKTSTPAKAPTANPPKTTTSKKPGH